MTNKVNVYLDGRDAYITRSVIRDEDFRLYAVASSLDSAIKNMQALHKECYLWIDKAFNRPEGNNIGLFEVVDGYVKELGDDSIVSML